jgi:hypothetical protein
MGLMLRRLWLDRVSSVSSKTLHFFSSIGLPFFAPRKYYRSRVPPIYTPNVSNSRLPVGKYPFWLHSPCHDTHPIRTFPKTEHWLSCADFLDEGSVLLWTRYPQTEQIFTRCVGISTRLIMSIGQWEP